MCDTTCILEFVTSTVVDVVVERVHISGLVSV